MAAEVLAGFPKPEVVNALLSQIENKELRFTVISVLGRMKQPGTETYLVECLTDAQRCIRMAALDGLAGTALDRLGQRVRHEQALVGRHDDRVDLELGNLPLPDVDLDRYGHVRSLDAQTGGPVVQAPTWSRGSRPRSAVVPS